MKRILAVIAIATMSIVQLLAQKGVISGRVADGHSGNPLDYADVVLTDSLDNAAAAVTVQNGRFSITGAKDGRYTLSVLLIGYDSFQSDVFDYKNDGTVDFGTIRLTPSESYRLEGVSVTADKQRIIYKLGRQVVSGTASLAASGGTAVDILKSIPSVLADSDGEISFRGSKGFLVYVDGKPSTTEGTQALEQIPASTIEDIEIITTPSAKYKTDGDAGIINIKTKRNLSDGISGSVNLSASTIGIRSGNLLLSRQKGKNRWYIGGTAADISRKSDFSQQKTTMVDGYTTTSDADGVRFGNNRTYTGSIGWEYDDSHRIHLLVELQGGDAETARGGDMSYYEHRVHGDQVLNDSDYDSHDRYSNEKRLAQAKAECSLTLDGGGKFSATGRMRYDWYALEYTESNLFDSSGNRHEGTRGYEDEHHWDSDCSLSYEKPFREEGKIETGYQFSSYSEIGGYDIKYWDRELARFEWQDNLAADFYYRRQIHSLYAMVNDRIGRFSYDAGLRGDWTLDRLCITVAGADRNIKRLNLFPSAHLSCDVTDRDILTFGYSYRTNRPGIWQLEPYITYEDYYTKKTGNPDIRPEYIHSAEMNYRRTFSPGNSLAVGGFLRSRKDVVDRIRIAFEPGVTLDSLVNAGKDLSAGLEMEALVKPARWWSVSADASLFHYRFTSGHEGCSSSSNVSYAMSLTSNLDLGKKTKMQLDANFIGPARLTQGSEDSYFYFDLSAGRQLMKNRLTASIVAHDIFRTACYDNRRNTPTLISATHVKPKYPNILFSLSYSFKASGHRYRNESTESGSIFEGRDF